ncbi:ABC transporter ATP-binding protein [Mycoplasma capricolum subsp. capripneumoniae]|uniref:ABC transporter ATP-binding protein n=1 Tax=Mycoplasma capricolum TaxID=2095 RepID=UPI0002ED27C7|nr:ABC transporter ATP-binding protein [Mycoplasma capricolum]AOQ21880.1 peptide ABC transporter ATP-binding protein [Mycoplasma capricolum subsp. capripneumoniae M1601]QIN43525.1 ABC transporter ATP-binding protein [Mycoplasma capricolum subsp. capripneumoniae]QIN44210.1 ABC transporter ATP-binding protein [Mycoplasma capricolum subsp. capripneumoniae]QIN46264.1 ABC transporter ATP-binding protein [Mycoplasma capricolum subsp. capripneumoniae]QIN46953.1 ABC transporter ATP-binding protein [My
MKVEIKNAQGYSKKFKTPLVYNNMPIPLDLFEIKDKTNKSYLQSFINYWKNKLVIIKNLFNKSDEQQNVDVFKNVQQEEVFGKLVNVAAHIDDVYLSFKNPANPREKNVVLRGPSLKIYEGKVHALIGESGSGKSVITSLLYGLSGSNSVIESGSVKLYGLEVHNFNELEWEKSKLRGRIISAVFQNSMSILDPTMKIGNQIIEGMLVSKIVQTKKQAYEQALNYLKLTKINNPEQIMKKYPHELSGGMIQRVAIACIISLKPKILVMDEPTTALDPTVQALVLDVIRELQEQFKIAIAFITHDLGVVASIADFINIMYAGQIVESGTKEEILLNPQHPYTWGLITSMPDYNKGEKLQVIRGSVPANLNKIEGDAFAVRNDYALDIDFFEEPPIYQISPTHFVKSNLLSSQAPKYSPPKIILNLWKKYDKTLNAIYGDDIFVDDKVYDNYKIKSEQQNSKVALKLKENKELLEKQEQERL